jgi:hypothetical protein
MEMLASSGHSMTGISGRERGSLTGRGRGFGRDKPKKAKGIAGMLGGLGGLGGAGGSKVLILFVGVMVLRVMLSRRADDSHKPLPRKYREIVDSWSNTSFEPDIFGVNGSQIQALTNLSTGAWDRTAKFRKLLKAHSATQKAAVMEKAGTRVLVVPGLLSSEQCAAIVAASQGNAFTPDPTGQDRCVEPKPSSHPRGATLLLHAGWAGSQFRFLFVVVDTVRPHPGQRVGGGVTLFQIRVGR